MRHLIAKFNKYSVLSNYSNITRNLNVSRTPGRFVTDRRGMTAKSTSTKLLVGIVSQYFIDQAGMDILAKGCPSACFVAIKYTDVSLELLKDLDILIADPACVCKYIHQLPKLRWIQSTFSGVSPIVDVLQQDKPPPKFVVTRHAGVFGPLMAEYVVGHIIALERKFSLSRNYQQDKIWGWWKKFIYRPLSELTIGILGFGDIGKEIAKYCKSMKMTVNIVHRTVPSTKSSFVDESFSTEELPKFLQQCDYICNVLPSTPSTRGLLSGNILENCKERKTVLINIGRGDVISCDSILNALNNQWIGGAILDVFKEEPLPNDSELWTHPQVTITPHIAGLSTDNQVIDSFMENFELFKEEKPMKYVVDWSKGY
ncbi:uncharacterized protein LOC114527872 [Dendronephthya gigantea]|uniref:uncharacterized protein LOC114527872 n=1 Tax=Dendronephthya gigantea TaxID=151771 RepID=UPI00106BF920|nr:uncharacterized protein LOC114527872 [Dendronephthya gigantea]